MQFLLCFLLFPYAALAAAPAGYKAVSSTAVGQGNFSQGVSLEGDHPVSETGAVSWSAGYSLTRTPVGNDSNRTNAVDLGLGYRDTWDFGGGINFSATPAENLTSIGPKAWLGYVFGWGPEGSHSVEPRLTYQGDAYKQTFSGVSLVRPGSRRTVARPVSGSESIRQSEWNFSVDVNPWDWLGFRGSASTYKYSRDVNSFLALLDSPRAVSTGASSFSATLGGFPKSSAGLGITLYPADKWDFVLDFTRTKVQADNTVSSGVKVEAERELSRLFKLGVGFDHEKSELLGEENLTLLDLTFSF